MAENIMKGFSAVYKKKFREMLSPHGYKNWRSIFFKQEDDMLFLICVKGKFHVSGSSIWTFVQPLPYCIELEPEDLDLREMSDNMFHILQRIDPDKFTLEHYFSLIRAAHEDNPPYKLDVVCELIVEYVLPYIHKFTDLEFAYSELPLLTERVTCHPPLAVSEELFHLSIKLRKYENALIYIDNKLSTFNDNMNSAKATLSDINSGNIDEMTLAVQKKRPDILDLQKLAAEEAIVMWGKEITKEQGIRDALLSNDHNYLNNYIKETENKSRESLNKLLTKPNYRRQLQ